MIPPTWTKNNLRLHHADCMEIMRQFPDNHFHLAIVDPPYGIGAAASSFISKKPSKSRFGLAKDYGHREWDSAIPDQSYFDELFRVSRNQIVWGGNYFMAMIRRNSSCWISWDKENGDSGFADMELAFTSFNTAARKFGFRWAGMLQGDMANREHRIHPTQKPVALYRWLLANYAEKGQRILDTHLGSGSHAIAAHYAGMDFTGIELDADYFTAACERIERETAQADMFTPPASPAPALSQPSLAL